MPKLQEVDLYKPIKGYLESLGYEVKGEIKECDIVAKKADEIIIIELKLSLNITLLLQAVDRFSVSDLVYIAVPKQCTIYKKKNKQVKKLIARLGLGLMVVDFPQTIKSKNIQLEDNCYVEVINDPKDYNPRKIKRKQAALLKEFSSRIGDTKKGGSTTKQVGQTAYRQRCIRVANYLSEHLSAKGADIKKAIAEPQATTMMYQNYYGWFENISKGVYQLSEQGKTELPSWLNKSNN